ncbi:MAG: hypothetical protein IMZ44_02830 [Planctomycetes bacterium]|nr:hypothetical protein [Planctomycetota bacterium]
MFLLERHMPGAIRRRMLRELIRVTADGFRVPLPEIPHGSDEVIGAFARFTRELVERVGDDAMGGEAIRDRLFHGAREMGHRFRRSAGIRTPGEAERALRLLYRAIGIELNVDLARGEMTVGRCAFSDVYTPEVCRFISGLDAGIVDGIARGTTVVFTERITEGAACCRATMVRGTLP